MTKFKLLLLLILITYIALLTGCGEDNPLEPDDALDESTYAQQVVELTNEIRVANGFAPIKLQAELVTAAQWMVQDMADYDYFDHTDRLGREPHERVYYFGYIGNYVGENIAAGQRTPDDVMAAWMDSPGHRANIINPNYREIGVGYVNQSGSVYQRYWAQNFGARVDVFPVIINQEAAETTSRQVSIYAYGQGWADMMRLSNDGATWSEWQNFQANSAWTLSEDSGPKTVYMQLKRGTATRSSQDTIELVAD